jgi:hypothetical protein
VAGLLWVRSSDQRGCEGAVPDVAGCGRVDDLNSPAAPEVLGSGSHEKCSLGTELCNHMLGAPAE